MGTYKYKHCGIGIRLLLIFMIPVCSIAIAILISTSVIIILNMDLVLDRISNLGLLDIIGSILAGIVYLLAAVLLFYALSQMAFMLFIRMRKPVVISNSDIIMPFYIFKKDGQMKNKYKISRITPIEGSSKKHRKEFLSFLRSDEYKNTHVLEAKIERKYLKDPDGYLLIKVDEIYYPLEKKMIKDYKGFINELENKLWSIKQVRIER